jgi:MFS transporter, ACS family, pantothenate transporter
MDLRSTSRSGRCQLRRSGDDVCVRCSYEFEGWLSDFFTSWANQICADDDQERGIVLASMKYVFMYPILLVTYSLSSMWNNVINAWWPLVFYPATDAPRFTKGMWAMIGTAIATLGVTVLVYFLEQREKRQRSASHEDEENDERKDRVYDGSSQK